MYSKYKVVYDHSSNVYRLWEFIINPKEKIYPISWKWDLYSHVNKDIVIKWYNKNLKNKDTPQISRYN